MANYAIFIFLIMESVQQSDMNTFDRENEKNCEFLEQDPTLSLKCYRYLRYEQNAKF